MNRITRTAAGLALAALPFAACSGDDTPASGDIPRSDSRLVRDDGTRTIFENAEDFNNVVAFCDGTTRVYTTTEFPVLYVTDAVQCGGTGERTQMSWYPR